MGKKFKKRKKDTAHRTPPLSKLDRAIYIIAMLLFGPLILGILIGWDELHERIAFRDPNVIAFKAGIFAVFPFLLFLVGVLIALACCYSSKRPIFGDKTIRYGDYPWKTDLFPLFGPQRKAVRRRDSEQRFRTAVHRIAAVALILSLLTASLGVYRRTCLRDDRTIVTYNSLNQAGEPVSIPRGCDRITIKAEKFTYRSGAPSWYYGVIIYSADGKKYEFTSRDFNCGHTDCIRQMLAIKALFSPGQITVEREDLLDDVIEHNGLDEAQSALLRRLFEQP